jgi:hypothetical protein
LAAVSSGSASCSTGTVVVGTYPVTATYSGDSNYHGSTAATSFTVDQASTSFTASAAPTSTTYGTSVTLSATGLPSGATGTVTFTSGSTTLCADPVSAGSASCSTGTLPVGAYPVTATYSGDSNYLGSTATTSLTVDQAWTSFTASAVPSSTTYRTSVILSATGLPADATGTVTFTSGSTTLCSGPVSAGSASCSTGTLPVGAYPVTATYSGDSNYLGSTATTSFTINRASTSFTASAAPGTATYGTSVTLSATGLPAGATGTVTFTSGPTTLCSAPLVSGSASCSTGTLPVDAYPVTATYSADGSYAGSIATTSFTISKAPTSFTASAAPSSTTYGTGVTLSATGLPSGATGTVTFTSGSTTLCSGPVTAGSASCSTGILPVGAYRVTATYSGDSDYLGSTATTSFTIDQASTSLTASAAPSTASYGTSVTLSAAGLPGRATGTVTFTSGATFLCLAPVHSGSASCSTGTVPVGSYPVTATYSGDANYLGSTAHTAFVITARPVLALTVSGAPTSVAAGGSYTLTLSAAVTSAGGPAANDPVISITLPAGETFTAAPTEAGWDCAVSAGGSTLTCTSTAATPMAPGTSLDNLTVVIDVDAAASGTLPLSASLSDAGDGAVPVIRVEAVTVSDPVSTGVPDTGASTVPPGRWELGLLLILGGTILVAGWRRRQQRSRPNRG